MPTALELSLAVDVYDRTKPLVTGEVTPEGTDVIPFTLRSPERHRRMLKHVEFDVCELSFASYLATIERDYPFTAIPVFPHRKFRHGYFFVNSDAGIQEPNDLAGKAVGVRRWQNTAALWMRGIAQNYYGVDLERIDWYVDDEDEVPIAIPSNYNVQRLDSEQNLNDMLVRGELDAAMYPMAPTAFVEGRPEIKRLFPEYKAEERQYYRDTGHFPIMHTVVIRDEIVADHPWVPTSVRKCFEQAKAIAMKELADDDQVSLVWAKALLDEQLEILGDDPWANGVDPNRSELEAAIEYACSYGLLSERVQPESLFIKSSLEDLPSYV